MTTDGDPDRAPVSLGDLIRRQRELADLSMRQLADMAGISNPYLSQIERGLRAPSDQVLGALADSLQLSADLLRDRPEHSDHLQRVIEAINACLLYTSPSPRD